MARTRIAPGRIASRLAALVALVAMLVPAATAQALVIPRGVEWLARGSRSVVVARVAAVTPRWSPTGEIVSDVDLVVDRRVTGSGASTVRVTVPGGRMGDLVMAINEAPSFVPGERCVLFLDAAGRVVADRQGKLDVVGARVPGVQQSLATVETRIRRAITPPTTDPWYSVVSELVASAPEPPAAIVGGPTITGITPSLQSAGTTATVTITGSGFGATSGSVTFYRTSLSRTAGAVVKAWSDTSIVCEIPSGAGSGSVIVTTSGGTPSPGSDYTVGFSYSGKHWKTTTMTYYLNPNCLEPGADELAGVQIAAGVWNAQTPFRFTYGGVSAAVENTETSNLVNEVFWASSGFTSGSTLAWNRYWYYTSDPTAIIESDIVFNDAYAWGDASSSGTVYDIATVALHEMGHSLSLDDQYGAGDAPKVMYGSVGLGAVRRTLWTEDAKGIAYIFGVDTVAPTTSASVNGSIVASGSTTTWLKTASVTLSANEPATRYYAIDGGPTSTYASAFAVTPDGTRTVSFWSVDAAANKESTKSITVRVDSTPPTTTADVSARYTTSASIDIVSSDAHSGVEWVEYELDGTIVRGASVSTSALGIHDLRHRARDIAGNESGWSTSQTFEVVPLECTLTYSAGTGGSIAGSATQVVGYGSSGTSVTAEPDPGYHFLRWSDDVDTPERRDIGVTSDVSVTAEFAADILALTYSAGTGGSIAGSATQVVGYGSSGTSVTAEPDPGFHFVRWSDGVKTPERRDTAVTADVPVTAEFAVDTFTITASAGPYGSISPPGASTVASGTSLALTITPVAGYQVAYVLVDGISQGAVSAYTFTNVTADHTISAVFSQIPPSSSGTPSTPSTPPLVRHARNFSTFGYIIRHPSGSAPVTLYFYRYQSRRWVLKKSITAKVSNWSTFSRYSKTTSVPTS
ncbi:MAG: IPT/TIG domain-containing protein, partial [Coriobacteriia bacterium]|nr:IPT/TIG domain-containing protein [Coriobacteriia bacterium]